MSGGGEAYNRYWGENHFGDGYVQRFGHSNTGGRAGGWVAARASGLVGGGSS